jgi:hypothetical protein
MIHSHMSTTRDKESCMSCDTSVLEILIKHLGNFACCFRITVIEYNLFFIFCHWNVI